MLHHPIIERELASLKARELRQSARSARLRRELTGRAAAAGPVARRVRAGRSTEPEHICCPEPAV